MACMRSGARSPSAPPNNHSTSQTGDVHHKSQRWASLGTGLFLFLATALIVVWQNSRLAVLWDLSYVLENAHCISLGDVPYRDFPFPYPPLTFLIQAAIIKLTGRVFWHHIVYCAVVGGVGTVLTWRILLNLLRETLPRADLFAFILSLSLIVLGIYCVFPHPFYDPDCSFAILLAVLLLQRLEQKPCSFSRAALAGAALVIPLFVKQNTGLAFIAAAGLGLAALMTIEAIQRRPVRRYALILAGALITFAVALALIHFTGGLRNYWHWTINFAATRRTPAPAEMLEIYRDKMLLLWLAIFAVGAVGVWFSRRRMPWLSLLSSLVMSVPFVWPTIYLLRDQDASERAERLLSLWPLLLVISFVTAIITSKGRRGVSLVLPFILIGTVHGAFMSQQLWGSTYAIWPLFLILLATTIVGISSLSKPRELWTVAPLIAVVVVSLLISGAHYVRSHERLDYANLDEGELRHSTLPQLKGLATRGDWIPDFEELIRYTNREIPRDDGILILPGEDLFYYTTGRRPRFPVLLFDHTVNPYSPDEIRNLCRERNIRWLIVKRDLQNEDDQVDRDKDRLTEVLDQDFEQVESLSNYDIYRRNDPDEAESIASHVSRLETSAAPGRRKGRRCALRLIRRDQANPSVDRKASVRCAVAPARIQSLASLSGAKRPGRRCV